MPVLCDDECRAVNHCDGMVVCAECDALCCSGGAVYDEDHDRYFCSDECRDEWLKEHGEAGEDEDEE